MQHPRLHKALADALSARGYEQLTPVQSAVVAEEADGRDLIVSAKTGSGKTVAFGMAMAEQLFEAGQLPFSRGPLALGHRSDARAGDPGQSASSIGSTRTPARA